MTNDTESTNDQQESNGDTCSSPPEFQPNEERYLKTLVPHESKAVAESELNLFFEAINELREKHKVSDMVICAHVRFYDGEELRVIPTSMQFGSAHSWESLAAIAYGEEKQRREKRISAYVSR